MKGEIQNYPLFIKCIVYIFRVLKRHYKKFKTQIEHYYFK